MAKRTWEQEKAYNAKRAAQAITEMEAAIETHDRERFETAWQVAMRYMNGKARKPYYLRFLKAFADDRADLRAEVAAYIDKVYKPNKTKEA